MNQKHMIFRSLFILFFISLSFYGFTQSLVKYNPYEKYEAQGGLFDIDSLRTLSINFYDPNYHNILVDDWFEDNSKRLPADIELSNGVKLNNVAIRYKGNSTFFLTNAYQIPKLPLNIDMNDIVSGQKLMGYKKLKLANSAFDATFVKEIIGYSIYRRYLPSPEANFLRVNVQGDYLGLYVNVEPVDKTFLTKHFNEKDGILVKCDPIQRYGVSGPSGRSDLKYHGSDSTLYYNHYDLKSDYGWKDFIRMINVLNYQPEEIESVLNVDRVLWAFAVNQVLLNLDTYNGVDQRNYYMYQTEDGLFQMIPWDVSESFINALLGDFDTHDHAYQYNPYKPSKSWQNPLVSKLTADPDSKYGRIYTAHLRTILEESLDTSQIMAFANKLQNIAYNSVKNDPNSFWDFDLYTKNLYNYHQFITYQFAGLQPTITYRKGFLQQHPELLKVPPTIAGVEVHKTNSSYYITSNVSNANTVELMVSNNGYNSKFKSYQMYDNGTNGDQLANDGIYTAAIAYSEQTAFYIRAENNEALKLSPERAEYEFYKISTITNNQQYLTEKPISVYPNPTTGVVYIKGDIPELTPYEVFSAMGRIIDAGVIYSDKKAIDFSQFATGMYFIKLQNKTFKIVKTD